MKNQTLKVWLEPGVDAALRRFCNDNELNLNQVIRYSVGAFCHDLVPGAELPTQRAIYGKLSKQALTVRLNPAERKLLERLAMSMKLRRGRSFSVFVRYALNRALQQLSCDDGSRREQSPAPACEGSPLPSAS